jgi:hypothetical protein
MKWVRTRKWGGGSLGGGRRERACGFSCGSTSFSSISSISFSTAPAQTLLVSVSQSASLVCGLLHRRGARIQLQGFKGGKGQGRRNTGGE